MHYKKDNNRSRKMRNLTLTLEIPDAPMQIPFLMPYMCRDDQLDVFKTSKEANSQIRKLVQCVQKQSQKTGVQNMHCGGRGVFAKKNISLETPNDDYASPQIKTHIIGLYCAAITQTPEQISNYSIEKDGFYVDAAPIATHPMQDEYLTLYHLSKELGSVHLSNHSCAPNCRMVPELLPDDDGLNGIPFFVLCLFEDIRQDEEVTWDYGDNYVKLFTKWPKREQNQLVRCRCSRCTPLADDKARWMKKGPHDGH
jgi:SET domain